MDEATARAKMEKTLKPEVWTRLLTCAALLPCMPPVRFPVLLPRTASLYCLLVLLPRTALLPRMRLRTCYTLVTSWIPPMIGPGPGQDGAPDPRA